MGNQHRFACKVCNAGPETAAFVEREILELRHSYKRVAAQTGFSKSTLHRHCARCANRRVALAAKDLRCPPNYDLRITMADGQVHFYPGERSRHDHSTEPLPLVQIDVEFEPAVAPRLPASVTPDSPTPEIPGNTPT